MGKTMKTTEALACELEVYVKNIQQTAAKNIMIRRILLVTWRFVFYNIWRLNKFKYDIYKIKKIGN